ncbi:MAG: hypothetical protein EBV27_03180 [Actinobacteria bacterium]|jgi:hypothetical protein|nr:hypothetical protein [Actinomycetota bacterium]
MDKFEEKYANPAPLEDLTVQFYTSTAYINTTPGPEPAINNLPDWWKDRPIYQMNDQIDRLSIMNNRGADSASISVKHCMPFFDAITCGYHYLLPTDVHVAKTDDPDRPDIWWDEDAPRPIEMRGHLELPVPSGCYPIHFVWDMRWGTKMPEGWSAMITHPIDRYDLPFFTMTAIQDSDRWFTGNVVTFFLRKDFEGTIKKGTPIMSIIPIKRANWTMEVDHKLQAEGLWDLERKRNYIYGFYKKHRWIRKKYR